MPTTYYVSRTGSNINNGTSPLAPKLTITAAITSSSNGDTIMVASGTYNESLVINKSITLKGEQNDVSAINNDGTLRSVANETIVQGHTTNSGNCFNITSNNVEINGFKVVLPNHNRIRDAFNLQVTPAGVGLSSTLENIVIKNNIVQNLRTSGQSQAITFGESTTNNNNASNGDGIWNNVEIANNYFDSSTAGNGYRGIQFGTHFKGVYYNNINIHDNRFVNSSNITLNRAIGITSYIAVSGRDASYFNNFKIKNNYFNTPGNSGIGGLADCDGNTEVSNNTFMNCKYAIESINFRENGGKIENNNFTVTEYAISFSDNAYATTNGSNVSILNNTFNGSPERHIRSSSQNVDFSNLYTNNTINGCVLKSAESTYRQFDNVSNPVLNRTTRTIYPTITKAIAATGIEVITVYPGTYLENVSINKTLTIQGISRETTILKSLQNGTTATLLVTDGAGGSVVKGLTIQGRVSTLSSSGNGNSNNNDSAILILGTDTTNNPAINNLTFEDLIISNASNGIAFNNKHSSNISIKNVQIRNNEGTGIRVASNTETLNGLTLEGSTIRDNNGGAISTNPSGTYRPNQTNFTIKDTSILNNNRLTLNNSHDISLFGFNGNLTMENVEITCDHSAYKLLNGSSATTGGWGLSILGRQESNFSRYPSGNLTIKNVTLSGNVIKAGVGIDRYSTLGDISMNNFNIKDLIPNKANQTWALLNIGHSDTSKSFNIGNTKLTTLVVASSGDVHAVDAEFYSMTSGTLINKGIPSNITYILEQIYDNLKNGLLGKVKISDKTNIISPSDPAAVANLLEEITSGNNVTGDILTIIVLPGGYETSGLRELPVPAVFSLTEGSSGTILFSSTNYKFYGR